jgi:MoaA/NifB/PqqE/SkfB family radical SAM enzyme
MIQPQTDGYLDSDYFLPAIGRPGGFLLVQGWFCSTDSEDVSLSADVRIAGSLVRIPCRDPRPDVAAADPAYKLHSGFNVTIPIPANVLHEDGFAIEFSSKGRPYGSLTGRVTHPDMEIDRHAGSLSELRLKKLRNLVLNERERLSQTERTASMPVTGQIDPSFACNLACPLCLSEMARQQGYSMPIMKAAELDHILEDYGDYLVRIWLSLWGEPLLNRRLPELIAKCKSREIWVLISSNMSVRLKDAAIEALVRSGLDAIILSIDGATQETYQEYRRGGDLALVLDNVRRLVETKRRLDLPTPHLYWRYLDFPWNRHEIELARKLAGELGVDEFGVEPSVNTPEVEHALTPRKPHEHRRKQNAGISATWQRFADERVSQHKYFGCDYLYQSISINSNGLVHPCCYVVSPEHAVGDATQAPDDLRNGPVMRASRKLIASFTGAGPAAHAGFDPCLSCDVMSSTAGHVNTQSSFVPMYRHLLLGAPIRW